MILDEAIKHAEELADYDCYNEKQLKCAEEYRQLAEWLKELKQLREQTRWIPVTEKLPEYGKEMLTCSNGGFIEIQSLENSCNDGYWENQKGDWTDFDEVVAWMPLPKSYKAESEGV